LVKNLGRFEEYADRFEQLPMYFMTFHGQENTRRVIEVWQQKSLMDLKLTVKSTQTCVVI